MIVAIHQPQFMPWLGYFDKMNRADHFVLLDNVQFKKNEWQNRNRIRTAQGAMWLTVPVRFHFPARLPEVEINNDTPWRRKHWQALRTNYSKAPAWAQLAEDLQKFYESEWNDLLSVNLASIQWLSDILEVDTPRSRASQMSGLSEEPTQRLVDICRQLGADTYLAGAGGRDYMDLDLFQQAGIRVIFQDYHHPIYPQLFGAFVSHLSALDLVLNCGADSARILRGLRASGDEQEEA